MNLESLDQVNCLRNWRQKAIELRDAAAGPVFCTVMRGGDKIDVSSVVSVETVRQAVIEACSDHIYEIEQQLAALSVRVDNPTPRPQRDAASWRRECQMYVRAWIRELGGRIAAKTHLIDALVVSTQTLRRRAEGDGDEARRVDWLREEQTS